MLQFWLNDCGKIRKQPNELTLTPKTARISLITTSETSGNLRNRSFFRYNPQNFVGAYRIRPLFYMKEAF